MSPIYYVLLATLDVLFILMMVVALPSMLTGRGIDPDTTSVAIGRWSIVFVLALCLVFNVGLAAIAARRAKERPSHRFIAGGGMSAYSAETRNQFMKDRSNAGQ